ncbi:MAG: DUF4105 domain-containing protein [Cellulophaga sp.]
MKSDKIIFLLLLFVTVSCFGQLPKLSPLTKISILTVGQGDELASTFGHSAIRITDKTIGVDVVYGYGTFDFTTSNFYLKFASGKLNYRISRLQFKYFIESYKQENRWVKEHVLDLSSEEKNQLFLFLENNYLPENRDYKYDFLFNNCATKIWEVLKEVYGDKLVFNESYLEEKFTFRELLHQHLTTNTWSAFGINLALGSVIDTQATPKEHLFLPIYVFKQLNYATLNKKPLAKNATTLVKERQRETTSFFLTPWFWLSAIAFAIITITYLDLKKNKRSKWLDFTLFFITGIAGIIVLLLWLATDHSATAVNFNFLWVFPLNCVVGFYLIGKKEVPKWIITYLIFLLALIGITVLLWCIGIQIFSLLFIPLLISFSVRYIYLANCFKKN